MPDTRERLLQAATAELVECGHAGISLRAVARRAGVSHAAPKNHFGDRAGLLTAVATRGFTDLAATLDALSEADGGTRLAALGTAYVDFGLAHPALFDLMWRPTELVADDAALVAAQTASVGALMAAVAELAGPGASTTTLTLMSWSLVHGLVVLTRDGALAALTDPAGPDPHAVAREVVAAYAGMVAAAARPGAGRP